MPIDLASRRRRLAAAVVDFLFNHVVLITLGAFATAEATLIERIELARWPGLEYRPGLIALAWLAAFAAMAIHAVLIARRGQSLAKIAFRLRIVRADGRAAGLYHGFVLRYLPFALLSLLPSAIAALRGSPWLVSSMAVASLLVHGLDAAMIAGKGRRCLHDRIADTWVVEIPAALSTVPPDGMSVFGSPRAAAAPQTDAG